MSSSITATTVDVASASVRPSRIVFIDVLRAYAILMMLQGHFVDTNLSPVYRDLSDPVFSTWFFMRGMTAPIFFFSTGLVFIYLLLKDGRPLFQNQRIRKGIRRGLFLIALGYILKLNLGALLIGQIYPWTITVDVLHVIGIALLVLIALVLLQQQLRLPLWLLFFTAGAFIFLLEPTMKAADWSMLPNWMANYFTQANGSVFTPIPWVGYSMWGGILGYVVHHKAKWAFTHWFPAAIIALGIIVTWGSEPAITYLYQLTGWINFKLTYEYNYLFWRLGHVLIVVGIFMWLLHFIARVPTLLTRIGSETLTIYSVHYVLLYGTWFGVGIKTFYYQSLSPVACIIGAILFLLSFVLLIAYIDPIRHFLYERLPARGRYQWRIMRVWLWRKFAPRLVKRQPSKAWAALKFFL